MQSLPGLIEALRRGEERLTEKLGHTTTISIRSFLDEQLISKITKIDHDKFREELWYSSDELLEKTLRNDFICFLVQVMGNPIAFLYGYNDSFDQKWFFLDEIATSSEGKGIGKVLIVLLLVYCYELGYTFVTLYTEDQDEKGRRLREFYEHLGFTYVSSDPEVGVIMSYRINEEELLKIYNRVMYSQGGPHPPYLRT